MGGSSWRTSKSSIRKLEKDAVIKANVGEIKVGVHEKVVVVDSVVIGCLEKIKDVVVDVKIAVE